MKDELNEEIDLETEEHFKINDTYTILLNRKIGSGSFGQIYQCLNLKTKEILACKIESINELNPQLYHESKIMNIMKNCTGFPTCYHFCSTDQDKIIVMDLLGANLDTIMNKLPNKKYSIKTSLMIMLQCLERIKSLHDKGIIHRDMKPENFVIGKKNKERLIYLIDFGLSKKYLNENNLHISMKKDRNIIGTVRYISMNTHQGYEQSRRDDLESLIYIIIFFIKGELPWQNTKVKVKTEKYNKIYEIKKESTKEGGELCRSIPYEFQTLIDYVLGLQFTEKPNYSMITKLVEMTLSRLNYFNDLQFDWYNLDFLTNLYKTNTVENNEKKSSHNNEVNLIQNKNENKNNLNIKKEKDKDKDKDKEKEIKRNKSNNKKEKINNKKDETLNINNDLTINNKNANHINRFKQHRSTSKSLYNSINVENLKNYKSPEHRKTLKITQKNENEIKTVKTFLEGKNLHNKKWNDFFNNNNKENRRTKLKSNNNIQNAFKK